MGFLNKKLCNQLLKYFMIYFYKEVFFIISFIKVNLFKFMNISCNNRYTI